jgi:SAM-dependent methyltransferase
MSSAKAAPIRRPLFVLTILVGSFLLFLVQPMVARMALPRLGGAPNVWNSAMLVYQALLLGGYAYAHWLSHMPIRRQATIHIGLLIFAGLTLPISLAQLPPPAPGSEALWVPLLFFLTIGPVFFLVSAQAPLMQRWFSAHPAAGEPWALYAASNLGSFTGLIAYPLLAEPLLRLHAQSVGWSIGYGLLIVLIALAGWARWKTSAVAQEQSSAPAAKVPAKRILLWLMLSAVPSGLMLSTTTHLTTDIFAMPLLWVIPLGLYLLSFVFAFSDKRAMANAISQIAPLLVLLGGGMAMVSRNSGSLALVLASVALLFVICVALHARLYDERPEASQLTLFYLVMSAGGALGGVFTALIAPLVFDWVWEHPLLVFAAAALLPMPRWLDWRRLPGLSAEMVLPAIITLLVFAAFLGWQLHDVALETVPGAKRLYLTAGIALCGLLLSAWRPLFLAVLAGLMLAQGGLETMESSINGARTRSYFGVYTVRDYKSEKLRTLAHGTTLHGEQSTDPLLRHLPITYYGAGSGAGIAFANAQNLFGQKARIGVVGLGTGTLACYNHPGEDWRFFEIDPAVLELSRNRTFTYIADCAPHAKVVLGDARLALAQMAKSSLDLLAIDAFSSDAIPLHLLTDEAFGTFLDVLSPKGVLLVHISNRYIELEPILAAEAKKRGLVVALRDDNPPQNNLLTASSWVLMTRDPAQLAMLKQLAPAMPWTALKPAAPRAWTDDHASILPYIRWNNFLRTP